MKLEGFYVMDNVTMEENRVVPRFFGLFYQMGLCENVKLKERGNRAILMGHT